MVNNVTVEKNLTKDVYCERGDIILVEGEVHILSDCNGKGYRLISLVNGNRFEDTDMPYDSKLSDITRHIGVEDICYLGKAQIKVIINE